MATDGLDPPPCDPEIHARGTAVCVIVEVSSNRMERFVKSIAESTGTRTDWHFMGGRALVLTLDDATTVADAIRAREEEIAVLQQETHAARDYRLTFKPTPVWYQV